MIWAEVYAGGIGGFVARLRPALNRHLTQPDGSTSLGAEIKEYLGMVMTGTTPHAG